MVDLSIYRWIRRNLPRPRYDFQIALFWGIIALDVVREVVGRLLPGRVFFLGSSNPWVAIAIYAGSVAVVGIPLKVWNSARIELKLEEQERLLLQARLDALQSQINPHFLFNTLNSISSLVRFRPEIARELIVKLGSILRAALGKHDAFVRLREEIEFIDNYLDIEVVRFGPEKLRVVKELDPDTLDLIVPSMLLQPLVENSIKHGLAPKIGGGRITLRSRLANERLIVEVEDDGVGMLPLSQARLHDDAQRAIRGESTHGGGIGMNNVAERLRVLYGDSSRMVAVNLDEGTRITLELPLLQRDPDSPTAATAIYEARS
jgi:two-component system LytT family sensor kinase